MQLLLSCCVLDDVSARYGWTEAVVERPGDWLDQGKPGG